MGIMAMDMARNIKYYIVFFLFISTKVFAGDWNISPAVSIEAIHSDNVNLSLTNEESSWVNKSNLSLTSQYKAKAGTLSLSGKLIYATFSHDTSLNDNFTELEASGSLNLWNSGAKLIANSSISNQSQNGSQNGLADIVSGDTVQINNNTLGLVYGINNSFMDLTSSYLITQVETGDNIGESNSHTINFQAGNSNSAKHVFWQINSSTKKSDNQSSSGRIEQHQAQLGWINTTNIIPMLNFSSETASGTISSTNNQLTSWGPGIRWRISSEFALELSYNYVENSDKSDDYVATTIKWQPSSRTSLSATHSQRFFGDSYIFNFSHQLRRLTNTITYTDSISAFDRSNGIQILGHYWCPIPEDDSVDIKIDQCVLSNSDQNSYALVSFRDINNETVNEFTLNKNLNWQSTLTLSRTVFSLTLDSSVREYLTSQYKTEFNNAKFSIDRKISAKSTLTISASFRNNKTTSNVTALASQDDDYRVSSIKYSKRFGHSLTADINIDYTDRDSSSLAFNYDETRASFNIKKDF